MHDYVIRYVVTHLNSKGVRTLCGPAQGHLTHATEAEAQCMMEAMLENNKVLDNGKLAGRQLRNSQGPGLYAGFQHRQRHVVRPTTRTRRAEGSPWPVCSGVQHDGEPWLHLSRR